MQTCSWNLIVFKGVNEQIPALLNVEAKQNNGEVKYLWWYGKFLKRNKFEKNFRIKKAVKKLH
jgi:hypothetical protein